MTQAASSQRRRGRRAWTPTTESLETRALLSADMPSVEANSSPNPAPTLIADAPAEVMVWKNLKANDSTKAAEDQAVAAVMPDASAVQPLQGAPDPNSNSIDETRATLFALASETRPNEPTTTLSNPTAVESQQPATTTSDSAAQQRANIKAERLAAMQARREALQTRKAQRRVHLTGDSQSDRQALVKFRQTHPGPKPKESKDLGDHIVDYGKKFEKFGRSIGDAFKKIF